MWAGTTISHAGSFKAPLNATGGNITMITGFSRASHSGHFSVETPNSGEAGTSGDVELKTGKATYGNAGQLALRGGNSGFGQGGKVSVKHKVKKFIYL